MSAAERFAEALRTGVCPDCGRRVYDPAHTGGPRAQQLAGHTTTTCTGPR